MERVREAPPSPAEEGPASLPSLPALLEVESRPLLERLEGLRGPGVTPEEVDAFLAGISAPRPPDEPPRVRADLMLDILEDERVCGFTGSDGRRVGAVALEALLELGYPYALEVTPEMLAQGRGPRVRRLPRRLFVGLGLAVLNVLAYAGLRMADLLGSFPEEEGSWVLEAALEHALRHLDVVAPVLLVPAVVSALAGWYELRPLKNPANLAQGLVTTVCLLMAWHVPASESPPLLITGVLSLVTLLCLLPRENPEP